MKNKIKELSLIVLIFLMLCLFSLCPQAVFASTAPDLPEESTMGRRITTNEITDTQLYYSLLEVYNKYYELPRKNSDDTTIPRQQTIYKNMFNNMDFSKFDGVLDLGGGVNNRNGIQDLTGLELIDFSSCINLTKINLSKNALTNISAINLSSLNKATAIDLSDNNLTSVDLSSLDNIQNIDVSNNFLNSLNLSFLKTESTEAIINISNNKINDVNNVSFRREELLTNNVNIFAINSLDIVDYVGNSKIKVYSGLSKLKSSGLITYSEGLQYNKLDNYNLIGITASDIIINILDANSFEIVKTINNSTFTSGNILQGLNFGNYLLYFTDQDNNSIMDQCNVLKDRYSAYELSLRPSKPTIALSIDEEIVELKEKEILSKNGIIKFSSIEQNTETWYKIGGGEWIKGDSVEVKAKSGIMLTVKSVFGEYESETVSYYISADNSFGWTELLLIILVLVLFIALLFGLLPLVRHFIQKPLVINKNKNENNK